MNISLPAEGLPGLNSDLMRSMSAAGGVKKGPNGDTMATTMPAAFTSGVYSVSE